MTRLRVANPDPIMVYARHGKAWLVGALVGLVLGGGVYWKTTPDYTATAVVELTSVTPAVDLGGVRGRPQVESVDTDAQMLASDEVVAAVAKSSGDSEQWAQGSLGVTARNLTRVLEITYTSRSPKGATAGANSAADGLLAIRQRLVIKPIDDYLDAVAKQTEIPLDAAVLDPADRVGTAEFRVESWRDRALSARLQVPDSGSVLQLAQGNPAPQRGGIEVPLTSGVATGALLGLLLGMAGWRLRARRTRNTRRIQVVVRQGRAA
jgi:hypothetical protein